MLTYNEIDMLPYSLPPLSRYFDHFLIIDMESTDGTCAFIEKQLGDRARVISYKRELLLELGYAHARNFAAANSEKQWVFMVDADEVLVDGVTLAGVSIELPANETTAVTLERRNLQNNGWRLGEPFDPMRFAGRIVKKDRLYRPSAKAYWEGYIHEELVKRPQPDAPRAGSFIRLDHLSSFRSPTREKFKRQMYSWMLLRVYRQDVPRKGVNQYWFDEYVPQRLAQIEADARAFADAGRSTAQLPMMQRGPEHSSGDIPASD